MADAMRAYYKDVASSSGSRGGAIPWDVGQSASGSIMATVLKHLNRQVREEFLRQHQVSSRPNCRYIFRQHTEDLEDADTESGAVDAALAAAREIATRYASEPTRVSSHFDPDDRVWEVVVPFTGSVDEALQTEKRCVMEWLGRPESELGPDVILRVSMAQ